MKKLLPPLLLSLILFGSLGYIATKLPEVALSEDPLNNLPALEVETKAKIEALVNDPACMDLSVYTENGCSIFIKQATKVCIPKVREYAESCIRSGLFVAGDTCQEGIKRELSACEDQVGLDMIRGTF